MLLCGAPGRWRVLDAFSAVPGAGLHASTQLDFQAVEVDFGVTRQSFFVGRGSVAIPGLLPGLVTAWRTEGRLPLARVLAPAIEAARKGVALTEAVSRMLAVIAPIADWSAGTRRMFGYAGGPPKVGTLLDNPGLADLLVRLAADPEGTLVGPWREAILATAGAAAGGLVTDHDLRTWRPVWHAALEVAWGNTTVVTVPSPLPCGSLVLTALMALRGLGWHGAAPGSTEQLVAELAALNAQAGARSSGRLDAWRDPDVLAMLAALPQGPEPRIAGNTTHISVVDGDGRFAAMTTSNGEGCGHVLPDWGVHLNNFLGEEDINPEGFHRAVPGSLLPTMMGPTAWIRGDATTILGSGGSKRIRSAIAQVLMRLAEGHRLTDAVAAPRAHVDDGHIFYEAPGRTPTQQDWLAARAPHATRFDAPSMYFGGVHAVERSGGRSSGAADARRGAAVVVVP